MASFAIPFDVYRILSERRDERLLKLRAKGIEGLPPLTPEFAAWFRDRLNDFEDIFEAFLREGSIDTLRPRLRAACVLVAEAGIGIELVARVLQEASMRGREDLMEGMPDRLALLPEVFLWLQQYEVALFDEFCLAHAERSRRFERDAATLLAQMDAVFNSAPIGLIFVDAARVIQRINQECCDMLGYPSPAEIERGDMRAFRERIKQNYKDPEGFLQLIEEIYSDPENKRWGMLEIIRPAAKTVAFTAAPVHDGAGAPIGWLWIFRDISDRLAAERLRNDLVHMIVHDLKNPLTAIRGVEAILRARLDGGDAKACEALALLKRNSERMLAMIMNLLDIERLEGGKLDLRVETLPIDAFLAAALEQQRPAAGGRELSLAVAPGLLGASLRVDPNLVERVLANLISNAIKHTRPDGRIAIEAGPAPCDGSGARRARISVIDNGGGIAPEFHDKIFEKFGQAELRREGHKTDTGLGLTFCKLAVEAHGGAIEVESKPGRGATFSFTAPLA